MKHLIALVGNQNCGKTTLFNALTGSNQHVGNFPGVTVEKKSGVIRTLKEAELVDLPGIYSLSPYTSEEVVARDFILKQNPDVIINIIDATNIERNLYLSLQLMELNKPMVIALNMMDEVKQSGNHIDVRMLSAKLGVPCVAISASHKEGIHDLMHEVRHLLSEKGEVRHIDFCQGEVHRAVHAIAHIIEDHAQKEAIPSRFASTKLIEGDNLMAETLSLHRDDLEIIERIVKSMEESVGLDREAALADMRYTYIENLVKQCVVKKQDSLAQQRSAKIDKLLTHKYLGIPLFLGIMLLVFHLTFNVIGAPLQELFEGVIDTVITSISDLIANMGASEMMHALIVDGILGGIGSVLSFLPLIVTLFFFLSLLEDSGYMARVAFVMDKALRKIGLSGKSFVPMLIGFGCSVPAIMSTRTLASSRDRKMTIIITPFLSCSAKLPIYAMITSAFFPDHSAIVLFIVYCIGMLVAILSALLLKNTLFKGDSVPFVLELPAYRMPSMRSVVMHMWEKAMDFIKKAFTVIFLASVVIWFATSFTFALEYTTDSSISILASIGNIFAPLFKWCGFGDWRAVCALFTGITAKESVVSTLSVLANASTDAALQAALQTIFTPLSAFAYLVFTVLYMPCMAAFAATKREMGSMKEAILTAFYQCLCAYIAALLIYQVGGLLL